MKDTLKTGIACLLERVLKQPPTVRQVRQAKAVFLYAKCGGRLITKGVYFRDVFLGRVVYTKNAFRAESRFMPNIGAMLVQKNKDYWIPVHGMQRILDSVQLMESYQLTHTGW